MVSCKGAHFVKDLLLTCVRWSVADPLSYRHVAALMQERGVSVDHATVNRWVLQYSPPWEEAFPRRQRPVWISWRMNETYIQVRGQWRYLYGAVDKTGQTIDFLLAEHRDEQAAKRFLTKAIRRHGLPETSTIDGSEANAAAIQGYNAESGTAIVIRQVTYLKNIVEQDHRGVKRGTRPMLGFKSFNAALCTLAGVELMHMLGKGPREGGVAQGHTPAEQFHALAAYPPAHQTSPYPRRKLATEPGRLVDMGRLPSTVCSLQSTLIKLATGEDYE